VENVTLDPLAWAFLYCAMRGAGSRLPRAFTCPFVANYRKVTANATPTGAPLAASR